MNNNSNIKKNNLKGKKVASFISLLLGIVGITVAIGHIYNMLEGWTIGSFKMPVILNFTGKIVEQFGAVSYIFLLTPIIGLLLGILGLSAKKNIAIGGIIFSIIGIIGLLIFFILALGFATGM